MPTANPARRPGATSGYVPVNGLDMYYEIHGDGSPLAHGGGQRLFADISPAAKFTLAGSEAYSNGVLYLTYSPAAPAMSDA